MKGSGISGSFSDKKKKGFVDIKALNSWDMPSEVNKKDHKPQPKGPELCIKKEVSALTNVKVGSDISFSAKGRLTEIRMSKKGMSDCRYCIEVTAISVD